MLLFKRHVGIGTTSGNSSFKPLISCLLTLGNILFEWNKFQPNQKLLAADLRLELESPDSQTGIPCITLFYSLNKLIDSITKREQHPPPKFLYTEEHPEKKSH